MPDKEALKIYFVSLGCDKNLVDSEKMLGILAQRGFAITDEESEADAVVVNTCCFIGDAKEESIGELLRYAQMRSEGKLKALVAAGCLAQRYREEVQKEIPEVDALVGTASPGEIAEVLSAVLEKGKRDENRFAPLDSAPVLRADRILSTGGHYAYLKIAEGCDKNCTYCIIPKIRGPYRSVPMEDLLSEARRLALGGVRELILVAQETTLYGRDLYGKKSLSELLRKLSELPELKWIRILYAYPEEIEEELLDTIAALPKVCHYLDIPIQHASDAVLRQMGRRTRQEELRERIARIREKIPDICLRTTLIAGFPGETQEDYEELYRFVNEIEFDRLGVFAYSREEDTVAAGIPDQIPEEVKILRRDELMELQQAVCADRNEEMVGRTMTAMIEGRVADEEAWESPAGELSGTLPDGWDETGRLYVARTYRDAPGVDGYLFFRSERDLMSGTFVEVRILAAREYDLIGEEIISNI